MINLIIFSKDRAAQLQLLLTSIKTNAENIFNVNVLYQASNDEFLAGYKKLQEENILSNINWVEETNFKKQNVDLLTSDYAYTCFGTDDDIIYKTVNEKHIIDTIDNDEDIFCFSLRLGKNVTVCYTMNCDNVLIPLEEKENIIKWDWSKHLVDFGYPLSVDFHIFRTKDISKLSKQIPYTNPNTFEGGLQIFDEYPKYKMASFTHSVVVNTPNNIVNETHPNRQGEKYGISAEELNKKYLNGETILLNEMMFENIVGAHQEIDFAFSK